MLLAGRARRCIGFPSTLFEYRVPAIAFMLLIQVFLPPVFSQTSPNRYSPPAGIPAIAGPVLPSPSPTPPRPVFEGNVFEHSPPSDLATEVRQILPWFPIDTEAITVVRTSLKNPWSAEVDADLERGLAPPFREAMACYLMTGLIEAEFLGRDREVINEHVYSGKPLLIVSMARYVGHMVTRQQACVLRFEKPSSMFEELRRHSVIEHTLHRHLVLEGVNSHRPDPVLHSSSLYFVSLTPDTLLVTSHLLLAKDILHRISRPKAAPAVSPALTEWSHVDYRCPAWGIRVHPSKARSRNRTDERDPTPSFTMWYNESRQRVTIRCIDQEGKASEVLERLFVTRGLGRVPRKIVTSPDGRLADMVFPITRNSDIDQEVTAIVLHSYDSIICPLLLGTHFKEQLPGGF